MTWADVLADGSGKTAFRLVIEGLDSEFVTDPEMVASVANGVERRLGLKRDGLRLRSGSGIIDGKLDADGFTATIADIDELVTACFARGATLTTFATADLSTSATTLSVTSTTGWPTSGVLHVGTECIAYSGVTATSFTGLTRGVRSTIAQTHYSALTTTASRRSEVTDYPVTIEGRRAYLYAYGQGDSPTGNGTLVFRGVVSRDANLSGPATWSVTIDGMRRVLEQDFVGPANGDVTPRGIYYSWASPLQINLQQTTGANLADTNNASRAASISFTGFYETQDEFCGALQAVLDAAMSGWETSIQIVSEGANGWYPNIRSSATARFLKATFLSLVDKYYNSSNGVLNFIDPVTLAPISVVTFATNTTYRMTGFDSIVTSGAFGATVSNRFNVSPGSVPRGTITQASTLFPALADAATWPENRIYIQADAGTLSATAITLSPSDNTQTTSLSVDPALASAANNYIVFTQPLTEMLPYSGRGLQISAQTETMPTSPADEAFGAGLVSLISWLISLSPSRCNLGGIPLLVAADFDAAWKSQIQAVQRGRVIATQRRYYAPKKGKFLDYLAEECKLIGCFPALNASGQIKFVPVQLKAATETAAATIDASTTITGAAWPGYERSAMGTLNEVVVKTAYDPMQDKHLGTTYNARDVTAYSRSKMPRTLEIAPRSADEWPSSYDPFEDIIDLTANVLGIFGRPYHIVTVPVPWSRYSVTAGDAVTLTNAQLPNTAGGRGVTDVQGLVLAKDFAADAAHGTLTLLVHGQNIAGYTPVTRKVSQSGSGTTWAITVGVGPIPGYVDASAFRTGDRIRVYTYDTSTTTEVAGVVTSVAVPVINVTFDATWTPGSSTWNLGFDISTNIAAGNRQTAWAFIARSTSLIVYASSATSPARTYAP